MRTHPSSGREWARGGFSALLLVSAASVHAECVLDDESQIDVDSHTVVHDFESGAGGCSRDFGPSGIVYHPRLDRLLVISDKDGHLAIMRTDGSGVKCREIRNAQGNALDQDDHEGITYADPDDGFIFVGLESGDRKGVAIVRQVELSSFRVVRTWKIGFPGGIDGNDGLESLTFVPDESHPEGGTFYVGDQTAKKVVGGCEVPIRSGGDTDMIYGCTVSIDPKFDEVSGLDYAADAEIGGTRGVLLVSSDKDDTLKAFAPDGKRLDWKRQFPESSKPGQEGHAVDGCTLYVSSDENNDARKVHRYRFAD